MSALVFLQLRFSSRCMCLHVDCGSPARPLPPSFCHPHSSPLSHRLLIALCLLPFLARLLPCCCAVCCECFLSLLRSSTRARVCSPLAVGFRISPLLEQHPSFYRIAPLSMSNIGSGFKPKASSARLPPGTVACKCQMSVGPLAQTRFIASPPQTENSSSDDLASRHRSMTCAGWPAAQGEREEVRPM